MERRAQPSGVDELVVWSPVELPAETLDARLGTVLPFFERHVLHRGAGRVETRGAGRIALGRRVLDGTAARTDVPGPEGSALVAEAIAGRAMGLVKQPGTVRARFRA
jgi:hypothetical protein